MMKILCIEASQMRSYLKADIWPPNISMNRTQVSIPLAVAYSQLSEGSCFCLVFLVVFKSTKSRLLSIEGKYQRLSGSVLSQYVNSLYICYYEEIKSLIKQIQQCTVNPFSGKSTNCLATRATEKISVTELTVFFCAICDLLLLILPLRE